MQSENKYKIRKLYAYEDGHKISRSTSRRIQKSAQASQSSIEVSIWKTFDSLVLLFNFGTNNVS